MSLQQDGASSGWLSIGIENVRYLPKNVFHDSKERSPNTGISNGPSEPRVAAITGHCPVFTAADTSRGVPLAHHSYNSKKGACMRRPPEDQWISGQSQDFPFGSCSRNWLENARLLHTFPSLQTKILCSIKKQKTSQACSEKVTWLRPFPLWENIGAGLPTGVAM